MKAFTYTLGTSHIFCTLSYSVPHVIVQYFLFLYTLFIRCHYLKFEQQDFKAKCKGEKECFCMKYFSAVHLFHLALCNNRSLGKCPEVDMMRSNKFHFLNKSAYSAVVMQKCCSWDLAKKQTFYSYYTSGIVSFLIECTRIMCLIPE